MSVKFQDGYYGAARRIYTAPKKYPFAALGDLTTATYVSTYRVEPALWAPTARGTEDPENAGFYLIDESEPDAPQEATIATFTRTYGSVPTDQVTYSNLTLSRPTALAGGGTTAAGTYVVYPSTAAIAAVTFDYATLLSTYLFFAAVVYGPRVASTSANSGGNTRVTKTGHGLAGTESIVARYGVSGNDYCVFAPGTYSIVDADNFDLLGVNWAARVTYYAKYYRAYTPGTGIVRTRLTQKFYTDSSTIPVPATLLNDPAFMAAVLANLTGFVDYSATAPALWQSTPFFSTTLTALNFADL